jgi:hypothetical protein
MGDRQSLLLRAAECYLGAGLRDDACRCLEQAGDFAGAARQYESLGRPEQAAAAYQHGRLWHEAARCFLACGRPLDAAQSLENAGVPLQAAWVLAEVAQRYDRARALAHTAAPETPAQILEHRLVLARCEAGNGHRRRAADLLAGEMRTLASLGPDSDPDPERLLDWALGVATALDRADLASDLFALARQSGTFSDLERRWETWAMARLGMAAGVPAGPGAPAEAGSWSSSA